MASEVGPSIVLFSPCLPGGSLTRRSARCKRLANAVFSLRVGMPHFAAMPETFYQLIKITVSLLVDFYFEQPQ
jgi:hypothetical protein